ncbi:MAG TPA: Calx-beta domain-containing protein [Pyrinomonadaceae bacterium]|jgi:hypothetical protein
MLNSYVHNSSPLGLYSRRVKSVFFSLALIAIFIAAASSKAVQAGTIYVQAGGDFQAALNSAQPGDTIVLTAGAIYKGAFTLPFKYGTNTDADWITITTNYAQYLPGPGQRITPGYAWALPKIVPPGDNSSAIYTAAGAHHYRFIGIEFSPENASSIVDTIISLGNRGAAQDTLAEVPHHLTLDRCYIYAHPTQALKRGVYLNGAHVEVLNSHVAGFKLPGQDSQAMAGMNGPGPFRIINNYLEGAGENLMFGGEDPAIPNLVPSDIEIRHNYFYKPPAWRTSSNPHWSVKNLLELKNAQRVVIDGNIFEYSWADAQDGYAILFTVRNQENTAPWSVVQDVQFTNNIVRHAGSGIQMLGSDYTYPSQPERRINISNNIFEDINHFNWGGNGWFLAISGSSTGVTDLTVNHNTIFQSYSLIQVSGGASKRFVFTNNIAPHNDYGVKGDDKGSGDSTLNYYFPGAIFLRNLIAGAPASLYQQHPDNFYPPASSFYSQFVNPFGSPPDYHLVSSSPGYHAGTDGKDVGADIDAVNSATSGATTGTAPAPTRIGFSTNYYSVNEGDASGVATVTVVRDGNVSGASTVDYLTSDAATQTCQTNTSGNASEKCDYATAAGTLRFAAGETVKTIQIPLINDAYVEPTESFNITLRNPQGATIYFFGTAAVSILNNDAQVSSVNPINEQEFFIRQQYIDFLGRVADSGGLSFWMNRMNNCPPGDICDRTDTSKRFFESDEFRERGLYVYLLNDAVLGKRSNNADESQRPSYREFIADTARLNGYLPVQEQRLAKDALLLDFMNRPAFRSLYGQYLTTTMNAATDPTGFVNKLFQVANIPMQGSYYSLLYNLQTGARDPAHTVEDFIMSPEIVSPGTAFYDRGYITMQYFGYLRRDPDIGGYNNWVYHLTDTSSPNYHNYRFMVNGFITSHEYGFRFNCIFGGVKINECTQLP